MRPFYSIVLFLLMSFSYGSAQVLTLKDAVSKGLANYGTIKAKEQYLHASQAGLQQSRRDYLPNVVVSAQQDYGTVNGQNGPLYGFGGYGVSSSGLPLPAQNWNAAFGALYLANVNWEFFTFGRIQERIRVAKSVVDRDSNDVSQERFQHQVRVAAAYLNLLAAQRITHSQERNLERAMVFYANASTRAKSGLIAGVDSSMARAEVSNARIALTRAKDVEKEQTTRLAFLMGVPATDFVLDTAFVTQIPKSMASANGSVSKQHPMLMYYQSRLNINSEQVKLFRRSSLPSLSLVGVYQTRGSGFEAAYTQNQKAFSHDYGTGVTPTRSNYLVGLGLNWNLMSIYRNAAAVKAQKALVEAAKSEYELASQQLETQSVLADTKIVNAMDNYREAPVQVRAATEAYQQKSSMYKSGLTTLVDVTQSLYILNRAETDRDIAYSNVWQALLLKVAATGDLQLFMNEF